MNDTTELAKLVQQLVSERYFLQGVIDSLKAERLALAERLTPSQPQVDPDALLGLHNTNEILLSAINTLNRRISDLGDENNRLKEEEDSKNDDLLDAVREAESLGNDLAAFDAAASLGMCNMGDAVVVPSEGYRRAGWVMFAADMTELGRFVRGLKEDSERLRAENERLQAEVRSLENQLDRNFDRKY